jgi:hypothetical protein
MSDALLYGLVGLGGLLVARRKKSQSKAAADKPLSQQTEPLRMAVLAVADAEEKKKVREASYNSDTGYRIDDYQAIFNMRGGMWCAAFVSWIVMTALNRRRPPKWASASTSWLMVHARNAYRNGALPEDCIAFSREPETLSRVKPGWIFVKGTTADGSDPLEAEKGGFKTGHTGIVVDPVGDKPGYFKSIEGNTCVGTGCNGGGVYYAQRKYEGENRIIWFDPIALTAVVDLDPSVISARRPAS